MRMVIPLILLVVLVLVRAETASACTSFATYFAEPIFGFNFDYLADREIRFVVVPEPNRTFFAVVFDYGEFFVTTACMTTEGRFAVLQEQHPLRDSTHAQEPNGVFFHEVMGMFFEAPNLEDLLKELEGKRIVQTPGSSIHMLLADGDGSAAILEEGAEQNEVLPAEDGFLVMTNFKHSDFRGLPYDQVRGVGDGRYITAYEHIQENRSEFVLNAALHVLRKTVQPGLTRCSLVFVPSENSVYLALRGDFTTMWRVSLKEGTIEKFRGPGEQVVLPFPEEGISAKELVRLAR